MDAKDGGPGPLKVVPLPFLRLLPLLQCVYVVEQQPPTSVELFGALRVLSVVREPRLKECFDPVMVTSQLWRKHFPDSQGHRLVLVTGDDRRGTIESETVKHLGQRIGRIAPASRPLLHVPD